MAVVSWVYSDKISFYEYDDIGEHGQLSGGIYLASPAAEGLLSYVCGMLGKVCGFVGLVAIFPSPCAAHTLWEFFSGLCDPRERLQPLDENRKFIHWLAPS
jgi:hypothetical protein